MKKALIYWFSFLFILLWMTSCASRKVAKSTVEKENNIESSTTEKKDLEVKDNLNVKVINEVTKTDDSTTEKKIYTPIDPTKPSSYTDEKGNKKELNNTSYTEEKTTAKANKKEATKTNLSQVKTTKDKGVIKHGTRAKNKEVTQVKNTSRTSSFSWWWILLLLIALLVYLFRRYRDKIWWF